MADRVYNLTQTGAEVQAIINDADNAKGAGATTSLTTDYIMLKDTNGQYHKIQKDSFTEAVRNTLASLLVNNDKGTTISQIAAIASGDFGSVTPANLASVLGVGYNHNIGVTASSMSSNMQSKIEEIFQATDNLTAFDYDFARYDQEGRFMGEKHSATVGEGLWISKGGLSILRRNSTANDGTWIQIWLYSF